MRIVIFIFLITIFAGNVAKAEPGFGLDLKRGYIYNDIGKKCWYRQVVKKKYTYFHGTFPETDRIMTFENPRCMLDSGTGYGLEINKEQINRIIPYWYSHSDAKFKTDMDDLYNGSLMQKKGKCIQSETYPNIGVTIDYFIENNSIIGAIHGQAIQGCAN